MKQISTGKLREWSIFKGDNRSDKTDNSGYCPICRHNAPYIHPSHDSILELWWTFPNDFVLCSELIQPMSRNGCKIVDCDEKQPHKHFSTLPGHTDMS